MSSRGNVFHFVLVLGVMVLARPAVGNTLYGFDLAFEGPRTAGELGKRFSAATNPESRISSGPSTLEACGQTCLGLEVCVGLYFTPPAIASSGPGTCVLLRELGSLQNTDQAGDSYSRTAPFTTTTTSRTASKQGATTTTTTATRRCALNFCKNGGACVLENSGESVCRCSSGFQGDFCENPAQTRPPTSSSGSDGKSLSGGSLAAAIAVPVALLLLLGLLLVAAVYRRRHRTTSSEPQRGKRPLKRPVSVDRSSISSPVTDSFRKNTHLIMGLDEGGFVSYGSPNSSTWGDDSDNVMEESLSGAKVILNAVFDMEVPLEEGEERTRLVRQNSEDHNRSIRERESPLHRISFPPPPGTDPYEEDRHIAASRIQAVARGVLARRHSRELRERRAFEKKVAAVVCIQRYLRGLIARRELQRLRRAGAALLLQRQARGYLARKQYRKMQNLIKTEEYVRQRDLEHDRIRSEVWVPETYSVGKILPIPLTTEKAKQIEEQLSRRGKALQYRQPADRGLPFRELSREEWRANRRFSGQAGATDSGEHPIPPSEREESSSSSSDSGREWSSNEEEGAQRIKVQSRRSIFDRQQVAEQAEAKETRAAKGPTWRKFSLDLTGLTDAGKPASSSTDAAVVEGYELGPLEGDFEEEFGFC